VRAQPAFGRAFPWVLSVLAAALVVALGQRQRDLSRAYDRLREWATLPHTGLQVPAFTTSTLDGAPVTIGAAAAPEARQVLFVLRTGCPYCLATLPVWQRIADSVRRVATPQVELYGISLDAADSTKAYVRAHHVSYPVLTFPDRKFVLLYRAVATPETVVLDDGGRVLYARTGLLDSAAVLDSVFRAATAPLRRANTVLPGTPVAGRPGR